MISATRVVDASTLRWWSKCSSTKRKMEDCNIRTSGTMRTCLRCVMTENQCKLVRCNKDLLKVPFKKRSHICRHCLCAQLFSSCTCARRRSPSNKTCTFVSKTRRCSVFILHCTAAHADRKLKPVDKRDTKSEVTAKAASELKVCFCRRAPRSICWKRICSLSIFFSASVGAAPFPSSNVECSKIPCAWLMRLKWILSWLRGGYLRTRACWTQAAISWSN